MNAKQILEQFLGPDTADRSAEGTGGMLGHIGSKNLGVAASGVAANFRFRVRGSHHLGYWFR